MNEHDSEKLAGMLEEKGYLPSEERENADVIVVNTCSVRENADNRFFGQLGVIKKIKERHPDHIIAVCGCMMQQEHITDTIRKKYAWVDIIFGTMNLEEFPRLLDECLTEKKKLMSVYHRQEKVIEGLPMHRKYRYKSFVDIMNGCNNFCTYCIVPYTRGRERSRSPESIVEEIRLLAADGVKEVTLLGQNVNSYGHGADFDCDFAGLIRRIDEVEGIERIRFMTSHPKDLSDRLIEAFRDCRKLCRHIHLPVQSGSTRILSRMNRRYTKEGYLSLVEKIRSAVPGNRRYDRQSSSDFRERTEEDFEETMDLVRRVRFDSAFTFLYSIRTGTHRRRNMRIRSRSRKSTGDLSTWWRHSTGLQRKKKRAVRRAYGARSGGRTEQGGQQYLFRKDGYIQAGKFPKSEGSDRRNGGCKNHRGEDVQSLRRGRAFTVTRIPAAAVTPAVPPR